MVRQVEIKKELAVAEAKRVPACSLHPDPTAFSCIYNTGGSP